MLEADLNQIVDDDLMQAFRELFAEDPGLAYQELLEIIAMFSAPTKKGDAIRDFVAHLIMGLVGEEPHALSWFRAVAHGSFELRPHQDYGFSQALKSRARLLERQASMFIGNIEEHRRKWAGEVGSSQEGARIILFSMIALELRKNVAAKAALGPAWPLMVAVDTMTVEEKRQLYWAGGDNRLHAMLASAVGTALEEFLEYHGNSMEPPPANGDWARKLPPNVDAHRYFAERQTTSRDPTPSAEEDCAPHSSALKAADRDEARSKSQDEIYEGSPDFTYTTGDNRTVRVEYSEDEMKRLKRMLPFLTRSTWSEEMTAAAARAYMRLMMYQDRSKREFGNVLEEARAFTKNYLPPPANLHMIHACLFEEEICFRLSEDPRYLRKLQAYGWLLNFDESSIDRKGPTALFLDCGEYTKKYRSEVRRAASAAK